MIQEQNGMPEGIRSSNTPKYVLLLLLPYFLWCTLVCGSFWLNMRNIDDNTELLVLNVGRAFFKEIETTRLWNAIHDGVYVPITPTTQPNPYLKVPNRDVETTDGLRLTLINPAFMTRQIAEIAKKTSDIQYHITSLNPIRPENMADAWETQALSRFNDQSYSVLEYVPEERVYRYMEALFVKKPCLKCHEQQKYKEQDIRGGISVTIPAESYLEAAKKSQIQLFVTHLVTFLLGVGTLLLFQRHRNSQLKAHRQIYTINQELKQAIINQKIANEECNQARIETAEAKTIAKMTKIFEKFVPKQFLQRIATGGIEHIMPGTVELSTITIMFSDIRLFTNMSEQMPPHDVFALLNSYIARMQTPIEKNNGFIDKFIGDSIMALFDGPLHEQARNAVWAAIGMQEHLLAYNNERGEWGQAPIVTGIGLHIGQVILGTLGNENRMDSTVIGDAANLAARLEGLCKYYDCRIIISDDLFRLLDADALLCRPLDRVVVKGRKQSILVHEVFEADPEPVKRKKRALLKSYLSGFNLFNKRHWSESRKAFQECLEIDADDLVSRIYLERCAVFMEDPPAEGWDGSFEMQQK